MEVKVAGTAEGIESVRVSGSVTMVATGAFD
jgi:hypothetical protein